jgi:PKD repeat protein
MRKLYVLLAGSILALMTLPANARTLTPDVANFTFTIEAATSNVVFTNTSVIGNEPGTRRAFWSFGDGSGQWTGGLDGAQHHYQSAGTYTVCLKIYRIYSNTSDSVLSAQICKTVVIESVCHANFETVGTASTPLGKYFIAQPSHSQNKKPVRICWTFGDNHDTCIQYSTTYTGAYGVYHLYSQPGSYNVCVKILYDGGCEAQNCHTIQTSEPDSCRANFESPATSTTPLGRYFIAQPWHNHNKKPVRICWTFGDNRDTCIQYSTTYTGAYGVYHLYSQPGSYNVCVKILYDGGCEAHNCHIIQTGEADSCHADFERIPVTTSNNPLQASFRALPSHNHDKKPVQICWTFGDNRDTCIQYSNTYPGPYAVSHTYANAGHYEVCVKILYQGGCEARKCRVVEINTPDSCRANFERIPFTTVINPLSAYFRALPWHSNNKKPSRICWTFGDNRDTCINYGQDYTGQYVVNHTYQHPGQYEVCVKILYFGGCDARKCKIIEVNRPDSCRADFERVPITGTNNTLSTYFRALLWHNNNKKPARICWTFGDNRDTCINYGQDYTGVYAVNHNYQQPGQYEVCIKILYYGGCEARKCKIVAIPGENRCTVNIFELTPSINSLVRVFYASVSSVPPHPVERICWNFGDGTDTCITTTSSAPPALLVNHTYPGPGVYRTCVRVLFQGGCIAEACKEVVIRSNSHLCGGYMTDSLIAPRTFKFKAFAIHNPNDPVVSYRWNFGDGSTTVGQEVTHTYNIGGEYRVCLTILTQSGCETRICNTVRVPGTNQAILQLSPNPVVNVLHALFLSNRNENVTIRIINSNGVIARTYTRFVVAGPNNWDFDLATLLPGTYLFTVQSPNQLASAIFIKQ